METIMLIISIMLIIVILLQPPKSDNAAGTMSGTGVNVFAESKERGIELVYKRITIVLGAIFIIMPIIIEIMK